MSARPCAGKGGTTAKADGWVPACGGIGEVEKEWVGRKDEKNKYNIEIVGIELRYRVDVSVEDCQLYLKNVMNMTEYSF